jgi:hypothetical protein
MEIYNNYSLDELESELYIFTICVRDINDIEAIKTRNYIIQLLEEKENKDDYSKFIYSNIYNSFSDNTNLG